MTSILDTLILDIDRYPILTIDTTTFSDVITALLGTTTES